MRKILIDSDVEAMAFEYKQKLDNYKKEIVDALDDLSGKLNRKHTITRKTKKGMVKLKRNEVSRYHNYVAKLRSDYSNDTLTLLRPNSFETTFDLYNNLLNINELTAKISIDKDKEESLASRLISVLGYNKFVRQGVYPSLIHQIGIKSCVYCNANYAVTTKDGNGYFEIDHWKPESKYPFLSTSFYNLQPCCPYCNKRKGADRERQYFKLYEEDKNVPLNVFEFQIPRGALLRYIIKNDLNHLKIRFKAADPSYEQVRNDAEYKFGIEELYNEHIDVVEEMMWKAKFYNNVIIGSMTWLFREKHPVVDVARFKLGTYADEDEVHKRPLTKMMQDIGKQLMVI